VSSVHGSHNWPFLGTYILSSLFNAAILFFILTTPPFPQNQYDFILIVNTAIRTLLFVGLTVVSEILRVRRISLPDNEQGTEPLQSNGSAHYGTFEALPEAPNDECGPGTKPPLQKGQWMRYHSVIKVVSLHSRLIISGIPSNFMA
jgi:hypothetical protein